MPHLLKILSGTLTGVEYRLSGGDTIFHVGPRAGLEDGTAGQLLAASENAFYLPDDAGTGAFRIHVDAGALDAGGGTLRLDVRQGADEAWQAQALVLQMPTAVLGLHVAVRDEAEPWSTAVTGFDPTANGIVAVDDTASASSVRGLRPRRNVIFSILAALALVGGGTWYYWQYQPEAQLRELGSVLHGAPSSYQVLAGSDSRLHVFANDAAARTWAERASRRLSRGRDVHRVASLEARRLEERLIAAGLEVVVVRLDDARQPEVVLSGAVDTERRRKVQQALAGQAPYATSFVVSGVTDRQLLGIARARLATLGITIRVVPEGSRVSVLNDTTLDDAGLDAMSSAATAFYAHWGQRRITIHPQLWDDLLQGRSYRYSPGQLVSVGQGRWHYAGAVGANGHASP